MPLNIHEFTLDLTNKPLIKKNGSEIAMKDASFKRNHDGKYFEYKYYMNLSQTDCRISLEAFSANGRTRVMLLQYSISAFEVESAELQDEHRYVEQLSQRGRADKVLEQNATADPNNVGTGRPPRVRDTQSLPLSTSSRSAQRNRLGSQSRDNSAISPISEGSICHQSRQNSFSSPSLISNAGVITETDKECPYKGFMHAANGDPDPDSEIWDLTIAAMQNVNQQPDRSPLDNQEAPIPKRARRAGSTLRNSGNFSLAMTSNDLQNSRGASPDFDKLLEESDDSEYQVCLFSQTPILTADDTNII